MKHLILSDAFLLDHPVLDAEHQHLVSLLNECIDITAEDSAADGLEAKVSELSAALRDHIEHEEAIMVDVAYHITEEEKRVHQDGMVQIANLQNQLSQGANGKDIVEELVGLIFDTFIKTDMGLKGHLPEVNGL